MYVDSTSSPRADNYLIAEFLSYRRDVRNAGNMNLLPIPTPYRPPHANLLSFSQQILSIYYSPDKA